MNFLKFLLPFLCLSAFGAERITLTITITNPPVTTNNLVVNANTRIWTNASAAGYIATNLTTVNLAATNLYNQIASFPYSGPLLLQWENTNSLNLVGTIGGALAATASGTWATLTLSTQTGPQTYTALWPIENMVGPTNRTNEASALVYGLSTFSTNAFATNSTATSNHITKGASPQQYISSPLQVGGALRAAAEVALTNGFTKDVTNINSVSSNHVNYGNAIRSEGSGANSFQAGSNALSLGVRAVSLGNGSVAGPDDSLSVGTGAIATNGALMAIGNLAYASNLLSSAIGYAARAVGSQSFAVGVSSLASNDNTTAFGVGATATAYGASSIGFNGQATAFGASAFGSAASATHSNSTAVGASATTTDTNQVRLGTSTETVSIPGMLEVSGSQTNTIFTGTNVFTLAVSHSVSNITTLANGVNLVDPGFKTYIVVSGPSAAYSLDKLTRGYDGRWVEFEKQDSFTMTINDESGSAGGAATDRIRTGTGAAVTLTNNPGSFGLRYNASLGRWVLKWKTN